MYNKMIVVCIFAIAAFIQVPMSRSVVAEEDKPEWKQERERRFQIMKKAESEIVFYGKVVTQQGQAVARATVYADAPEQIAWNEGRPRPVHVETADDGTFTISKETYRMSWSRFSDRKAPLNKVETNLLNQGIFTLSA